MRARHLLLLAVLGWLTVLYLRYCQRFVAHENERATRAPGYAGGINSTS
jgi:hypothetical protein